MLHESREFFYFVIFVLKNKLSSALMFVLILMPKLVRRKCTLYRVHIRTDQLFVPLVNSFQIHAIILFSPFKMEGINNNVRHFIYLYFVMQMNVVM